MILTLEQLLAGKPTKIKGKEYFSTEQYVTPFLERMQKYTDDFRIQAVLPNQISVTQGETINTDDCVWNRVWIQAVLPDNVGYANHSKVIGMVYGLDTRKPISKIYLGAENSACTNLCIFNPTDLQAKELEPETPIDYSCINPMMDKAIDVAKWLNKLNEIEISFDDKSINTRLGQWVRNTLNFSYSGGGNKVKMAVSSTIEAYKLLYEKEDSPYYVTGPTSMYNVYGAFTQTITNDQKDIMNHCDKTLLLKQILGIF